jgi:hypothetical protein
MRTILLIIIFFLTITANVFGCTSCDGDEIEVSGVVIKETFSGLPNYESIEYGDKPETCWFIVLEKSMCFAPNGEFLDKEVVINIIQLVKSNYKFIEGKNYLIKGITFPQHTGHHHSAVLLEVKSIKEL